MAAVLAVALVLRTWGLEQNGWGADYYSAAVRSMALDWRNFFFASFDPAGFISIDKPPVAFWLQVVSVELFGYRPLSLLWPQALAGVATVALLHLLVRRTFGPIPALVAALLLAVTPVEVALNRTNNTDTVLLLVLVLAAWALLLAAESGSRRWLFAAMAGVGLAFNVKMLAAFIVLPAFVATYLMGDAARWRRRAGDLMLGAVVLAVLSLSWVSVCALVAPESRPYLGGSGDNTVASLVLGHNARSRFVPAAAADARPGVGPGTARPPVREATPADDFGDDDSATARALASRLYVRSPTGPLRAFDGQLAAQFAWWLPLAIAGMAIGWRRPAPEGRVCAGDVDRARVLAIVFWTLWTITYAIVYGYLGGIIHFYYLSTLGVPLAVLAGVGVVALCRRWKHRRSGGGVLPVLIAITATWQLVVHIRGLGWSASALWPGGEGALASLHVSAAVGAAVAAVALVATSRSVATLPLRAAASALATVALLVLPIAWSLSSVLLPGQGIMPSADFYRLLVRARVPEAIHTARLGQSPDVARLVDFLAANRGAERYLLATTTTRLAAPIIIATGMPVLARGGFHGLDAAVSSDALARMVREGEVRFAMVGDPVKG